MKSDPYDDECTPVPPGKKSSEPEKAPPLAPLSGVLGMPTGFLTNVESLRSAFDSLGFGVLIHDEMGAIIDANKAFAELFGYPREEIGNLDIAKDLAASDVDKEQLRALAAEVIKGDTRQFEWHGRRKDGTEFYAIVIMNPLDYRGRTVIAGCLQDITQRKAAQEQLLQSRQQLSAEVHRLRMVQRVIERLSGIRSLRNLLEDFRAIIDEIGPTVSADRIEVFIHIPEANALISEANFDPDNPMRITSSSLQELGHGVSGMAAKSRRTQVIADVRCDPQWQDQQWIHDKVKALAAVPMLSGGQLYGVLRIENTTRPDPFTTDDIQFYEILADHMAVLIENARLYSEAERTASALRRSEESVRKAFHAKQSQMEQIAQVQSELLPINFPALAGLEFSANCRPCADVGGDLYAVLPMSDGRVAVAMGDVSGHGAKATITMATTRAFIRAALAELPKGKGPAQALLQINRWLHGELGSEHFVTMWLGIWDPAEELLVYSANAHPEAVLAPAEGALRYLSHEPNFPLGLSAVEPELGVDQAVPLHIGDQVILYTDGWTETAGSDGSMLEGRAFLNFLSDAAGTPVTQLPLVLFMNFERHAANMKIDDDLTLLAFGRIA